MNEAGYHGNGGGANGPFAHDYSEMMNSKSKSFKGPARRAALVGGDMLFDILNKPCLMYDLKEVASPHRSKDVVLFRLRSDVPYVKKERLECEMAFPKCRPWTATVTGSTCAHPAHHHQGDLRDAHGGHGGGSVRLQRRAAAVQEGGRPR